MSLTLANKNNPCPICDRSEKCLQSHAYSFLKQLLSNWDLDTSPAQSDDSPTWLYVFSDKWIIGNLYFHEYGEIVLEGTITGDAIGDIVEKFVLVYGESIQIERTKYNLTIAVWGGCDE